MADIEKLAVSPQGCTRMDGHKLISSIMDELEHGFGKPLSANHLAELLDQSNFEIESKVRKDKLNAVACRVIALPTLFKVFNAVLDMQKIFFRLERQAVDTGKNDLAVQKINEVLAKFERQVRKDLDSIAQPLTQEEKEDRRFSMALFSSMRGIGQPVLRRC